jgi:hypothetical protein
MVTSATELSRVVKVEALAVDTVVALLELTLPSHVLRNAGVSLAATVTLPTKGSTLDHSVVVSLDAHLSLRKVLVNIQTRDVALKASLNSKSRMARVCLM